MQGMVRGVRTCQEILKGAILKHHQGRYVVEGRKTCSRFGCVTSSSSSPIEEKGLENITVAEVLMTKGDDKVGSWLCCRSDDTVDDVLNGEHSTCSSNQLVDNLMFWLENHFLGTTKLSH